ncbi:hypothetical protein [Methylococcus sp. EFPC2]|uniref:hypothetical protein n=1 Tax=Methylococcus sp. EFPC2 TaxID=2812648 RepID=UPI001967C928|nr:hypothetical protein [Methylococcus sp. EFPC2]QSA96859.1 hypothetical protein JWZ97_16890 [Methylococcus sp. EFPC2]
MNGDRRRRAPGVIRRHGTEALKEHMGAVAVVWMLLCNVTVAMPAARESGELHAEAKLMADAGGGLWPAGPAVGGCEYAYEVGMGDLPRNILNSPNIEFLHARDTPAMGQSKSADAPPFEAVSSPAFFHYAAGSHEAASMSCSGAGASPLAERSGVSGGLGTALSLEALSFGWPDATEGKAGRFAGTSISSQLSRIFFFALLAVLGIESLRIKRNR